MVRLVVHSALFVALFVPWGSGLAFPLGWLLFWVKVFVLVLLVTLWPPPTRATGLTRPSATSPVLLAVAFGALALAAYGF